MLKKIMQSIRGKDCELKERMLRTIILIGGIAVLIAITEIILVMDIMNMNDNEVKDRKLLLILAIVGIFYAGVILDIIILFKFYISIESSIIL